MPADIGITGFGAYIPRLRLRRDAIVGAHAWLAPQLLAKARGARAMANWDEDTLTMGVEAARDLLGPAEDRSYVDALYLASTHFPFAERQNAAIIATALTLDPSVRTLDTGATVRAGTSALLNALSTAGSGEMKSGVVIASDKRKTRAASTQELDYGDGAAALSIGADPVARYLGGTSVAIDFVDHFRGGDEEVSYHWEERWIRDEGFMKILPETIAKVLKDAKTAPSDIAHFVMPCPFPRVPPMLAKMAKIPETALVDSLAADVGDTGTAHSLLMLVHALQNAKPGDKILVAQFGSGCDVLLFEATERLAQQASHTPRGVKGALADRCEETNYMKFLVFNGLMEWEKGMRAEQDKKTALTTLYRNREMILGLVGGRCTKTGTIQFPASRISVSPNDPAVDTQEPYKFAERTATILSWSGDYLAFSLSPPAHYGMMVFDEGGRIMMDITDVAPGEVETGMDMRMVFRIKDRDERRGFTRYFWKATPVRGGAFTPQT